MLWGSYNPTILEKLTLSGLDTQPLRHGFGKKRKKLVRNTTQAGPESKGSQVIVMRDTPQIMMVVPSTETLHRFYFIDRSSYAVHTIAALLMRYGWSSKFWSLFGSLISIIRHLYRVPKKGPQFLTTTHIATYLGAFG